MSSEQWLPNGFKIETDFKVRSLAQAGEHWQIYKSGGRTLLLVVTNALLDWWSDEGLIEKELFSLLRADEQDFFYLYSGSDNTIEPVYGGEGPQTKADAISFVHALKDTRKLFPEGSLYSSLFVERYSRLLPLTPKDEGFADEIVLGTWLSGGVTVSVLSFRRLNDLCGWMPTHDLIDVVEFAGFDVPPDSGLLQKPPSPGSSLLRSDEVGRTPQEKEVSANSSTPVSGPSNDSRRSFSLPGRKALQDFFNEHVVDIIFNPERYQMMGIEFPSAIILHGPPGCGKTFAVDQLVEFIGWPSYSIDSNSIGSPYIHETSKKISEVFDKALDNAPSIVVIDEMESFLTDRRAGNSSGLHHVEEVAEFLRRIPEAIKNRVLVIGMTNMIDTIDPAILRRGRFDHVIEVGMPSAEEIRSLLDSLLQNIPKSSDLAVERYVDLLSGKPLSDAAFVVREAARLAAKTGKTALDDVCLEAALSSLPKEQEKRRERIGFIWDEEKD
jgi:hypothetical protein